MLKLKNMNKRNILKIITGIGIAIAITPMVQLVLSEYEISDLNFEEFLITIYGLSIFIILPVLPLLLFYMLITKYYFTTGSSVLGQVLLGLLTVLLYCVPTVNNLYWLLDIEGIQSSDALASIQLVSIPIIVLGLSFTPIVGLIILHKIKLRTLN